jgi:hypothetical protein
VVLVFRQSTGVTIKLSVGSEDYKAIRHPFHHVAQSDKSDAERYSGTADSSEGLLTVRTRMGVEKAGLSATKTDLRSHDGRLETKDARRSY